MFLLYLVLLEFWIIFESAFIIFKIMASKSMAQIKDFFENCSSFISLIGLVIAIAILIVTFFI
jgi:hypothetical protein